MENETKEILEIVKFLKDNAVVRSDLEQSQREQTISFEQSQHGLKEEIMTHMDGFIALHQKLDTELAAMR